MDLNQLSGNLRGNPLAGQVHLELAGDNYRLPGLDLRSGTARLTANGSFTKTAGNLDFRLAAPNLAEALANAGGAVTAQGHLSGPWKTPRVIAQASGQSLVYQTYCAETCLQADVDLGANGPLVVNLKAANVGLNGQKYDTVNLTSQGTRQAHQITLAVRQTGEWAGPGRSIWPSPAACGGRPPGAARSAASTSPISRPATGGSPAPAGLTAGTTQAALKGFCWTSGDARLCADGQWAKNGPWSGNGTVAAVPFSLLKPFLPADLQITGAVGGTFAGTGSPTGVVTANLDLRPGPGEIRYPARGADRPDPLRPGDRPHGRRRRRADRPRRSHLRQHRGPAGRPAAAAVQQDRRPLQTQAVSGRIVANFTNLGLVEAFVPDLDNTRGTLNADLTIGGTVAKPAANGAVQLQQAQVDVPKYGLQVRQIQFTAKAAGSGPIQLQGSAHSGTGTVTIGGGVALDGSPSKVTIEGRNFLASNTKEIKALVSPSLQVALNGPRIDVTGDITIPELTVNQEKRRRGTVQVSKDVIILPPSAEAARRRPAAASTAALRPASA